MNAKIIENVKEFFLEVKTEIKKVTFPTKDETLGTTAVVLVLVSLATIYLWVIDVALSEIIAKILP
ncbi:MAG: preprotein translocase subunit SecE [Nitrospirota bacterium]|jgi:preprotein translocase subunit SecE